ncbi:hypothetical protein OF83DRAFT_1070730 [Amylostereum chailletii]|nr:hypothetical protein OF83DRAFT_1070730 [Amylostereum chailletii]
MLQELDVVLPEEAVGGSTTQVCCICHVFNLTVKRTVKQIKAEKEGDVAESSEDEDDDEGDMPNLEPVDDDFDDDEEPDDAHVQHDDDTIELVAAEVAAELDISSAEKRRACSALKKITKLSTCIHFSPTLRMALLALCVKHRTPSRILLRPVATRWNSVSAMIGSALDIRAPINALMAQDKYKLQKCVLDDKEWLMLVQLYPVLQWFLLATKHMEQMGKPLLFQVIPAIDSLTSRLEDTASDCTLNIVVRAAALSGAKVLNKYYSKMDEFIMPRMAMSTC